MLILARSRSILTEKERASAWSRRHPVTQATARLAETTWCRALDSRHVHHLHHLFTDFVSTDFESESSVRKLFFFLPLFFLRELSLTTSSLKYSLIIFCEKGKGTSTKFSFHNRAEHLEIDIDKRFCHCDFCSDFCPLPTPWTLVTRRLVSQTKGRWTGSQGK